MNDTILTDEDEEALELLTGADQFCCQVTPWEMKFLESISEQESLTPNQRKKFESICSRILL